MTKSCNLMAFDLGASNGRAILGRFDGEHMSMQELHRFDNNLINLNGVLHWDVLNLYHQIKTSLSAFAGDGFGDLDALGIDTWGVDYGLLDKNDRLLSNPISYRQSLQEDMEAVWEKVPKRTLFERTGIASMQYNTLYQLYRRARENDVALENARTLLFMPDLLGYFLTGEKRSEYTITTTSMMYNPIAKDWDYETIDALELPHIFTDVQPSGTIRARLLPGVCEEVGLKKAFLAAVGSHDTASAVAAIPGSGSFAFCSSGTWSLFGVETNEAIRTESVYRANFSNEGTVQGGFRPLSNIMGLWLIQECRRDWLKSGEQVSWDDIVAAANTAQPLCSIIDPDDGAFYGAGGMERKIQGFCAKTNQKVPQTRGEIARCIYESLALKYRWALERLEEIKQEPIAQLNIVGGGMKNKLLNQMVADSIGRPVIAGPAEGAALGNLLMQSVALGECKDIAQAREIVKNSVDVQTYMPHRSQAWEDAYAKLLSFLPPVSNQ